MLGFLQRQALRRLRSGSPGPWGAVAVVAFGLRMLRRLLTRRDEVVYREVLKPGHEVTITHRVESRRALAKAERSGLKEARKADRAATA